MGLAALAFGLVLSTEAHGQVVYKKGVFREEGATLTLSVGFREMLSSSLRRRLRSGFATTVVMRVYLFEKNGNRNVSFSARTLKAVYDLWEERFQLRIEEPGHTLRRRLRREKDVVDRLTSTWRFPVAKLADIKPNTEYFVAIIAEVNPMSEALLAEVRRWLRNPQGSGSRLSGQSFFGSFVSIFVNNKIRRAEKTFRLRTQRVFLRR